MACLATDLLERLLRNQLPAADQAAVRAHLDGCPPCQHRLEDLVKTIIPAAPPPTRAARGKPVRVVLTVMDGPGQGKRFSFPAHSTILGGRSDTAHIRLPADDPSASRLHFLMEMNPPLCRILDLGSRNGTFVNGQRIAREDLHDGDLVRAGQTVLQVGIANRLAPDGGDAPREDFALPATALEVPVPTIAHVGPARLPAVAGYEVVREVGHGGMGVVYESTRTTDGARVALKLLRAAGTPTQRELKRFAREAEILQRLRHPNIVACLDAGVSDGQLYVAMEYVDGLTVEQLLARKGPLSVRLAVRLTCHVLAGLIHAHARRIVHRDIKPGNILISREGGAGRVRAKVADFGLARIYQASKLSGLTVIGDIGGTPAYMPPEQVTHFRDVQPAADQYSLGATLYHLLAGAPPLDVAAGADLFQKILEEEPTPLGQRRADLPAGLADVVHRALAKRADQRFADAAAFRAALAPFGQ